MLMPIKCNRVFWIREGSDQDLDSPIISRSRDSEMGSYEPLPFREINCSFEQGSVIKFDSGHDASFIRTE